MKDIEDLCKDFVSSYFIDDKLKLTPFGGLVILLFAIITPFWLLFLKVKSIFIKRK